MMGMFLLIGKKMITNGKGKEITVMIMNDDDNEMTTIIKHYIKH